MRSKTKQVDHVNAVSEIPVKFSVGSSASAVLTFLMCFLPLYPCIPPYLIYNLHLRDANSDFY